MTRKDRVQVAIGAGLYRVGELIFETDGRRQMSAFKYFHVSLNFRQA